MLDKIQSEHYRDIVSPAEQETTGLDINGDPIEKEWAAIFAGFIWGEAHFGIEAAPNGKAFHPRLVVHLRWDDGKILMEFQKRLGGRLTRLERLGEKNPEMQWKVCKVEDCYRIGKILETTLKLPFSKRDQLQPWLEAVEIKRSNHQKEIPSENLRKLSQRYQTLKRLHQFNNNTVISL
jgi:hypothetical protein